VDFAMEEATGLAGRVTDSVTSLGLAGATINLLQGGEVVYTTTSGAGGGYSVETNAGIYNITCSAAGHIDKNITGVVITEGHLTTRNIALEKSAGVSGLVTRSSDNAPIEGALVQLLSQRTGVWLASDTTDADGAYAIDRNLASGSVTAQCSAAGYVTKGATVTLGVGQPYALDFVLVATPTRLEGNILPAAGGAGISGARIAAYNGSTLAASCVSNLIGGYSLLLPGAGDYTIMVSATSYTHQQIGPITFSAGDKVTQDFFLVRFSGNPITLSAPTVSPASGNGATVFQYRVTYTHEWGKAPTIMRVFINGSAKTMTLISGNAYEGAVYGYSTTLSTTSHNCYFSFGDGTTTKRLPTSGSYPGPVVSGSSSTVSGNGISLAMGNTSPGTGGPTATYRYRVVYQNRAGRPATLARLYIDGNAKPMTLLYGSAGEGAVYEYATTLKIGKHKFYFKFGDGKSSKRLPLSGAYVGPVVASVP
jgi:hypothetical protein